MIQPDLILAIGVLLSVGLLADYVGRRTKIPRVTLLLGFGILATTLNLIPDRLMEATETVTVLALSSGFSTWGVIQVRQAKV